MLSRRFFREKTLQSLYAFYQGGTDEVAVAEKNLINSVKKLYELYIHLATLPIAFREVAQQRYDDGKQKLLQSSPTRFPSDKLLENICIQRLIENPTLTLKAAEFRVNWTRDIELVRQLFLDVEKSKSYLEYVESPEGDFESDQAFVCAAIKRRLSYSTVLYQHFADKSLSQAVDFDNVIYWVYRSIKAMTVDNEDYIADWEHFAPKDYFNFSRELLKMTILCDAELELDIKARLENWELERMALIDVIILKMALIEFTKFPSIPIRVTMNEFLDLTKTFSTDRSRVFVNGLLHRISEDYQREGRIHKSGRGLL